MLSQEDLELYRKDVRQLIAETGDPGAFILFDDPSFEKVRKKLRETKKKEQKK
ncbi:MAG: hypothetical protein ACE5FU_10285 [Nitrospinota bacterium]